MSPRVANILRSGAVAPGIGPDSRISTIKMNTSTHEGGSLVSLLFVGDEEEPRYVLRVPRMLEAVDRIERNYSALENVQALPAQSGTVPEPIYLGPIDGVPSSLETCLHGVQLSAHLAVLASEGRFQRYHEILGEVWSWMWMLHCTTWGEPDLYAADVCEADIDYLAVMGPLPRVACDRLHRLLSDSRPRAFATAYGHQDVNPNNVLYLSGRGPSIGVVDWEYAGRGCALFELYEAIVSAYLPPALPADDMAHRVDELWNRRSLAGRVVATYLDRYGAELGLTHGEMRGLFALHLAHKVASRMQGLRLLAPDAEGRTLLTLVRREMG